MNRRASSPGKASPSDVTSRRHLTVGWWALLLFVAWGLSLEALHGFKVGYYLDVSNSTRRLMWRLGHAHGTLFALINIIFGVWIRTVPNWSGSSRTLASGSLMGALVLMPLGFFLGGVFVYGGDPGIGVILVPPGGLLLIVAVFFTARASGRYS